MGNNLEINPIDKKEAICTLLQSLNCSYEIHTSGSDKEYAYLQEQDICITVLHSNRDYPLYIDLENEGEFTLSYYKWHAHYFNVEWDYNQLCQDLADILNNRKCVVVISSSERWLRSALSETKLDKNYDVQNDIKELSKEAQTEIKELKGTVELFYWDIKENLIINL